ncbi:BTB/POZ domain-containing protein [Ditylenchus destructor]|nr:BTB/POZ domain-containing protein [Ditylenchus destructor]
MSGNNSTPNNSNLVCLNVGGKVFQTTKVTLSRYPESLLARLINGEQPCEKDKSGAYFVDGDSEHFRTILTYLRRGVLNLDGNEKTTKDLLCEAEFYKIQPLVDEIRKNIKSVTILAESVSVCERYIDGKLLGGYILFSETQEDYEVLQALRDMTEVELYRENEREYYITGFTAETKNTIEKVLRGFGFVQESYDDKYDEYRNISNEVIKVKCWKFTRTIR